MKRTNVVFALLLSISALLISGLSSAGAPKHIGTRTLAPVHAFDPGAAKVEVSELRAARSEQQAARSAGKGGGDGPPAPPPVRAAAAPGEPVRNAYFLPSPHSALEKMVTRLEGKQPLVLSAEQFAKGPAALPKATAKPPAGKTAVRVDKKKGIVEIQMANRTELLSLELTPGVPVDEARLQQSVQSAHGRLFVGHRRPDKIKQLPDGRFEIHMGSVKFTDPKANRIKVGGSRVAVLRTPVRRGAGKPQQKPGASAL